jgi:hypothetical protein
MPVVRALIVGLAFAACAFVPAHAFASVHADDAAATRAYLSTDYAYERGTSAALGVTIAALEARAGMIGGECPNALTYAPRDAAFGELGEEADTTAFFAGRASVRSMVLRFAQTIDRLRWSDRKLTRFVRAEAAEERAIATIALPDVCADIAAWKASAYAALPQSAARFLARVQAVESLSGEGPFEESREVAIMRFLRPYEGPAQRRTARRIERLEARIDKRMTAAGTGVEKKLAAALGVSAL